MYTVCVYQYVLACLIEDVVIAALIRNMYVYINQHIYVCKVYLVGLWVWVLLGLAFNLFCFTMLEAYPQKWIT